MSTVIPIEHRRLKYVSQLNMGQSPSSEDVTRFDEAEGLPFLQGNAEFGSVSPTYKHTCNTPPKTAKVGDLLVSVRAPVGALNIADQMYGIGRGLCAVTWKSIEPRFGWWAMHYHRGKLSEVATGSTYEAVSAEDLGNLFLSFPDLKSQRLIADYLDRETARIDALVTEKEKMLALLEEKRAALISSKVTRGLDPTAPLKPSGLDWLGDIPAHWETTKFSWSIFISEGQVGPEDDRFLEMILIAPNHIESRTGRVLYTETANDQGAISGKYLCKKGDVIYSKIRPALRKVALAHDDCLCSADMYALRPNQTIKPEYLLYFMLSEDFSNWAELESARVAMPKINRESLSAIRLTVPPLEEQEAIVSAIKTKASKIDVQWESIRKTIELLKERRAALITATVTGQIPLEEMLP